MPDPNPNVEPAATALLVMDYQPSIIARMPGASELIAQTNRAIAAVRAVGGTVGYVRVAFADEDFAGVPPHSQFADAVERYGEALRADAPSTAIDDRVAPQPGDMVVRKRRVGAFSTTDLHEQLQERGIVNLLLAGVSTSGVVLSTVRAGADLDYRLFVLEDASGDPEPEVHAFLVDHILGKQAEIIRVDEVPALFGSR
jgi:nicotinamidase-related amidase